MNSSPGGRADAANPGAGPHAGAVSDVSVIAARPHPGKPEAQAVRQASTPMRMISLPLIL